MEDVKFVLLKKLDKITTPQWIWIVAAVIVIGAVALWAVYYRKKEGGKGVKIIAIIAACFFVTLFIAQGTIIIAQSKGIPADSVPLDDYEIAAENAESLTVEKTVTSTPKNGQNYRVGERISYTVTVRNDGAQAAENVVITDYGPYKDWEIARIEPGQILTKESGYYVAGDDSVIPKNVSYILPAIAILAGVVLFVTGLCVGVKDREKVQHKTDVRAMTYGALCVATAFVLSYIKMFSMPLGGSITLASMLPIMLYAYMYGTRRGLLVGLVYGLLQFVQKPEITHWAQVVLDYPVAFAAIGLAGISKHIPAGIMKLPIGTIIGGAARWIVHTLSGFLFFSEVLNGNALLVSVVYNGWYMLFDTLICFVLAFPVAAIVKRAGIGPQEKPASKKA
jgi:thiamine transporter